MGSSLFSLRKIKFTALLPASVAIVGLLLTVSLGTSLVQEAKDSLQIAVQHEPRPMSIVAGLPGDVIVETIAIDRAFIHTLPADWPDIRSVKEMKERFVALLLPHVLHANEVVLGERMKLLQVQNLINSGQRLTPADTIWVIALAERYRLKEVDIDELLLRVDAIPPSLALTQAAIESGWGRSRFALEGQALFGQWTMTPGAGIVPTERPADATYEIRKFASLGDSVRSYMRNLNSHRAYRRLRESRAEMRELGIEPDGRSLSIHLYSYSSRGPDYVADVQQIMRTNDLYRFDRAEFADS